MKKFQFNLQHLLNFRKTNEDKALALLADAQKKYQIEVKKKEELLFILNIEIKNENETMKNGSFINDLIIQKNYIIGIKRKLLGSENLIFKNKKNIEKQLRNYLFLRKQTKMIEILKENAHREYVLIKKKNEQKSMDDLVVMRFRLTSEGDL